MTKPAPITTAPSEQLPDGSAVFHRSGGRDLTVAPSVGTPSNVGALALMLLRLAGVEPSHARLREPDPEWDNTVGRGTPRWQVERIQRPPWADQAAMRAFYTEARRLTKATGIRHHVDHVIPLRGDLVSGLHVQTNLQVIPWFDNLSKGTRS